MYLEGGNVVKQNNETALKYFSMAAEKVIFSFMYCFTMQIQFKIVFNTFLKIYISVSLNFHSFAYTLNIYVFKLYLFSFLRLNYQII